MQVFKDDFEVNADGTVTLSAELLAEYGLKVGDSLRAIQTENGILIAPRKTLITKLLDEIGADLSANGFTLEHMLADSKTIRQDIYDEKYSQRQG
ncbi:MAG: AbrB/MazE/SpoVT family DNA-binding domain-containing protein [Chloroflexi bacterium]|nr:AbrB/MazE/SpoVT family DNA-binding domain-containing protein [Chloroflexota bacterium]MCC6894844.1 AbrB/MazE/SpoVT family DNA-binding domain-containing protein [Anaerolineae bacterium]